MKINGNRKDFIRYLSTISSRVGKKYKVPDKPAIARHQVEMHFPLRLNRSIIDYKQQVSILKS